MKKSNFSALRRAASVVGALALLGTAGQATAAATLTGNISSSGASCFFSDEATALAFGSGKECPVVNFTTANYIDFITSIFSSPGAAGDVNFNTGTVNFAPIIGEEGDIYDFSFGATQVNDANPLGHLLWSVTGTDANTWQYVLNDITKVTRTSSTLDIVGLGQLCIVEESTCGVFNLILTTQISSSNQRTTSFSLSQSTPMPEPGTLALLGLGLAGIGFAKRRRQG